MVFVGAAEIAQLGERLTEDLRAPRAIPGRVTLFDLVHGVKG